MRTCAWNVVLSLAVLAGTAAAQQLDRQHPRTGDGPAYSKPAPRMTPGARGLSTYDNSAEIRAKDPFRRNENHTWSSPYPGGYGQGCHHGRNCRYAPYGGYGGVYVPYGYAAEMNPAGSTATDRVLAGGGTFSNANAASTDTPTTPLPDTVRSTVPTSQWSDNYATRTGVTSAVDAEPAVLVLRDGTRREVSNYMVVGAFVVALKPEYERISMGDLDLDATIQANKEAGHEFKIPAVYQPR